MNCPLLSAQSTTRRGYRLATGCAVIALAAILAHGSAAIPPGYYDAATGLSGTPLKNALHNIIKNHTVIPYSSSSLDTADAIKVLDEDPGNTANVILHYKGTSIAKSLFGDSSTWNREHLWPQSMGADVSPKKSDLHHLFAEDSVLNSSRGNSVFNDVPSPTNSAYGNQWTSSEFEVRDPQKGDVARAILYMDVRYDGTGGESDLTVLNTTSPSYGQMGYFDALVAWSNADPPDDAERLRNDLTYTLYQHNRNPFVDHPEYVNLIYAGVTNGDTLAVASTNRATVNVAAGAINYPLLSLDLTANSNEWDLASVSMAKLGTLGDGSVTSLKLYRDNDNSGSVNAGDTLLDTRTFSAGSATFTLASPSRITTTQAHFLIAATLSATATNGLTLGVRVNGSGLTSSSSGGTDVNPSFSNIDSSLATVSGGVSNGDTLSVAFTDLTGFSIEAGATNYALVSMDLQANTNEWDLASVGVTQIGTISDANVLSLKLYEDIDDSGMVDNGDVLLDTRTPSAGAATFTLASPLRIITSQRHLLLAVTIAGSVSNGTTFQLQVNASSLTSSPSGGTDVNPSFSAFTGASATVTGGVTDGNSVSVSVTDRAPSIADAGTTSVPMLTVALTADANEWDLGTVSLTKLGTLSDANVTAVDLYNDANGDGVVDLGDTLLASGTFSSGALTLNVGSGVMRVTTVQATLLITAGVSASAPDGATLGVRLNTNGLVHSASGGVDFDPPVSASDSSLVTIDVNPWIYTFNTATGTFSSGESTTFLPTPPAGTARVRIGDGGGNFVLANPGTVLGSGSELQGTAPSSASPNKFALQTYPAGQTGYVKFKMQLTGGSSGTWYFFLGSGPTYTGNAGFSTAEVFTGLRWVFGAAGAITTSYRSGGSWTATGLPATPFAQDTIYDVEIYANNSTTTADYRRQGTPCTVAADKWDFWINGTRAAGLNKAGLSSGTTMNSMMFYAESSTGNVAKIILDDIEYLNSANCPVALSAFEIE